jgi:TDG/mug DNA glycosylase family protein
MLPDLLRPGLLVVFVGTSVSTQSPAAGHYYSNPTNKFWQLLAATSLAAGRPVGAPLDSTLPGMGIGLTDLVKGRSVSSDSLLTDRDYDVSGFLARIDEAAPNVIAFNGGKAADQVSRFLGFGSSSDGLAGWCIGRSMVYRLPSSSAAASIGTERKMSAWRAFGAWVQNQTFPQ